MGSPPLDPRCSDRAPTADFLTSYDQEHLVTYLRVLDGYADGADWREVARRVLHVDPHREPERARTALRSHLERARWLRDHGYRYLLRGSIDVSRTTPDSRSTNNQGLGGHAR
jgi:hypothetical protein